MQMQREMRSKMPRLRKRPTVYMCACVTGGESFALTNQMWCSSSCACSSNRKEPSFSQHTRHLSRSYNRAVHAKLMRRELLGRVWRAGLESQLCSTWRLHFRFAARRKKGFRNHNICRQSRRSDPHKSAHHNCASYLLELACGDPGKFGCQLSPRRRRLSECEVERE